MAINMICQKASCRFNWEDYCMKNMNEEHLVIGQDGKCETFQEGRSEWYEAEKEAKP